MPLSRFCQGKRLFSKLRLGIAVGESHLDVLVFPSVHGRYAPNPSFGMDRFREAKRCLAAIVLSERGRFGGMSLLDRVQSVIRNS